MADPVSEEYLREHGWSDLSLRPYQLEGVNWLLGCHSNKHGCILGDEMGLGKTCQTIAMLTCLTGASGDTRPHLVVCPLSVLNNWLQEFQRFAPSLKVKAYMGDKEKRAQMSKDLKASRQGLTYSFDVLVTTYETCLKDFLFLQTIAWHVLVVDEGHRLKNSESLLYRTLEQWDIQQNVLLTGTPVQNNLGELYALLAFVHRNKFRSSAKDAFVEKYTASSKDVVEELHAMLKPYLLRRTKTGVLKDLPEKSDVILYHGLSTLQKKLYKAILMKDIEAFENPYKVGQTRLNNILMQLRKCVNHPYLFDGVEPEPFELGEHLVAASAKLVLVDRLLTWLRAGDHKVLLFSQFTSVLDVLQDYLGFRGFTYERLDGSVRGEERFLAVKNFNQNDETFAFLLSTRAGGQGLNLTAADTVVFVDSDFNPQNDLQAAARAHRIGQHRPVKVVRLIGRNTVEEIILKRAEDKLKLTDTVIEKGEFDTVTPSTSKQGLDKTPSKLQDILKFGVDKLLNDETEEEEVDFSSILGNSVDGEWQTQEAEKPEEEEEECPDAEEESEGDVGTGPQSMYMFEGHDYSKESKDTSAADADAIKTLIELTKVEEEEEMVGERSLRKRGMTVRLAGLLPEAVGKPRKQLSTQELEARKKKRQEAAEQRALKAAEEKQRKKEALWKKHSYTSVNIEIDSEGEEEEEEEKEEDGEEGDRQEGDRPKKAISYVSGDVTKPVTTANTPHNIIVHCTDDSGHWGRGGLFSAISRRSKQPEEQYERAGAVRDLSLGDCHLVDLTQAKVAQEEDDKEETTQTKDGVALIVAQTRDRKNRLSGIKLPALKEGLEKVYFKARQLKASVHLPRIGHDTPGFNWYGTERLIHKILASKGIPTFIYYYPRKKAVKRKPVSPPSPPSSKASKNDDEEDESPSPSTSNHNHHKKPSESRTPTVKPKTGVAAASPSPSLDDFFSGVAVHLYGIQADTMTRLMRRIIALDGDVDCYVHGSTTHLVVSPDTDAKTARKVLGSHGCCVVNSDWLEQCLLNGKLMPTDPFKIKL